MSGWVQYEWDCETVADGDSPDHEDGEVLDHCHGASYAEVREWSQRTTLHPGTRHVFVLVRDDAVGRSWAYVVDEALEPICFDASGLVAARTPARFRNEVAKWRLENRLTML
jgi:hypothetical protein